METYSTLREFADSWFLIGMFGFFGLAVVWAFRPGSTKTYNEISQIPLRDDLETPSNACAKLTFSEGAKDTPCVCSPSRSVVSKISTEDGHESWEVTAWP